MIVAAAALAFTGGAAQAEVLVGVGGPMTGTAQAYGGEISHGAGKAVDDINADGGLLGQTLRTVVSDDAQAVEAARYVALYLRGRKVALVDDRQAYGRGLALAFKAAAQSHNIKLVAQEQIDAGQKDFTDLITSLKQAGATVIYFGGYYAEGAMIVRQAKAQGLDATLVGGDGLNDPKFDEIAGEAGDGTLMTFGPDPKLDHANDKLVSSFGKQGYPPEGYTLYAYSAVQVWAATVARIQSFDADKVEAGLRTYRFQTALGTLGFTTKGDRTGQGFVMYVWHHGRPVYAQR